MKSNYNRRNQLAIGGTRDNQTLMSMIGTYKKLPVLVGIGIQCSYSGV